MISKRELAVRICQLENDVDFLYERLDEIEKKSKRKVKKDAVKK